MRSTCTSREGFTLVELIVGLTLAVCLAVAIAPFWTTLQRAGAEATDETVCLLQGRVAIARFERDLRLAGAGGCQFAVTWPVLEASASQLVFLERQGPGAVPLLMEWEIVCGSLMRRWGPCPSARPQTYAHSRYRDSKTMLEGVQGASAFGYVVRGGIVPGPVPEKDLPLIEGVVLQLKSVGGGARRPVDLATTARVGR